LCDLLLDAPCLFEHRAILLLCYNPLMLHPRNFGLELQQRQTKKKRGLEGGRGM
jgi:hypothetical protein